MSVLEQIAAYVAGVRYDALASPERDALKIHLLDTMGAMIAGHATPEAGVMRGLTARSGGPAALAAGSLDDVAVRCATARMSEIDDIHLPSCVTPGSVVVPVALTMGARIGDVDCARFAGAVAAGYEVMTRLGAAVGGPEVLYRGVWPSYFAAPFAAAAIGARLLGLAEKETVHALAIALTLSAGGVGRWGPGWSARWLVLGHAARAGCTAALAAAEGYTGDATLLDGDWLASAHGIEPRTECLIDGLGERCVLTALTIKPFCSAKQVIAAIHGFREILGRGVDQAGIRAVRVFVPEFYRAMIDHGVIEGNRITNITSAPYQLAIAACAPDALSDVARTECATGDDISALMAKISVHRDDDLAAHYPRNWPARVEVDSDRGTDAELVLEAPGDPGLRFTADRAEEKFVRFAAPVVGDGPAGDWVRSALAAPEDDAALAALSRRVEALFA